MWLGAGGVLCGVLLLAVLAARRWRQRREERMLQRLGRRLAREKSRKGRRLVILVNPTAGGGRAAETVAKVLPLLQLHNMVRVVHTQVGLTNVNADMCSDADVLVFCGGDGTIHHAINRIGIENLKGVQVAVLPCGSSNGIATCLCDSLEGAIANILFGRAVHFDALELAFEEPGGRRRIVHELQVAAFGIIAEHDYLQEVALRPYMGPLLRGILAPLIVMIRANRYEMEVDITVHDKAQERLEKQGLASVPPSAKSILLCHALLIGGTPFGDSTGRAFPGAHVDDGAWDLVVFSAWKSILAPIALIRTFLAIHSNGAHVRTRSEVKRWPFASLRVTPKSSASPHMVSISGEEYQFRTSVEMRVLPNRVQILCEGPVRE